MGVIQSLLLQPYCNDCLPSLKTIWIDISKKTDTNYIRSKETTGYPF